MCVCVSASVCVCLYVCLCVCVSVCVTAIVLSMGTEFVNEEEIVSGTRSGLNGSTSFLTVSVHKEIYIVSFKFLFFNF